MKSTDNFKNVILTYLQKRAETDSLFAVTFAKPDKNIDDCISYIINTVQKSGCNGFEDQEIYSMAVHYYDEDGLEVEKADECTIITNHKVDLTAEDIAEAKAEAKKKLIDDEYQSLKKKPVPKPVKAEENLQTSLF